MTKTLGVFVVAISLFCCPNLSVARQSPKECNLGASFWCQNLRVAATCGALQHCISSSWEKQTSQIIMNEHSSKIVKLFRELKDVGDLINAEYLGARVSSSCHELTDPEARELCSSSTTAMKDYLMHLLRSHVSPEAMCIAINMCNSKQLDAILLKKTTPPPIPQARKESSGKIRSSDKPTDHCTWGPSHWCSNFTVAATCGAIQHCISSVWEKQSVDIRMNEHSAKIIKLFRELKDVGDLINSEYLAARVASACRELSSAEVRDMCARNTKPMKDHLMKLLQSDVTPETMCLVIDMCNSHQLDVVMNSKINSFAAITHPKQSGAGQLVGSEHCTWGPAYWCSNFSTGRECRATHHCVNRVWLRMDFPEDNNDVCKICKDMVQQARDQLLSNETQEELKQVFEGSCKLIPIKIVAKECIILTDDFVPELVETLASQMNPNQVCSVAGLCNNAKIDELLDAYHARLKDRVVCNNCHRTVGVLRKKFEATSYDDFLIGLLQMCGRMAGSLSDSCSMLVFKYYESIVEAVKKDLHVKGVCHISGQCAAQYHDHDEYTYPQIDQDKLKANDDVPCELCEQLVLHLRDTLTANTTELEFEKVLRGLCKQTGEFKGECLSLVEQYYAVAYNYLVHEMEPAKVCELVGLCGKDALEAPLAPLLPPEYAVKAVLPNHNLIGKVSLTAGLNSTAEYPGDKPDMSPSVVEPKMKIINNDGSRHPTVAPLPLERMFLSIPRADEESKALCEFCQYFLHYIQIELSDYDNEEQIKKAVDKACDKLPKVVSGQCREFVTQYGPAVIALLVQQIDPSSVCPALRICPSEELHTTRPHAQSNCPLCLFAVEQLEATLKNNRSEESIRHALKGLCGHLNQKLRLQCVDFVDTYSNQLVEMLVAQMNAQEICVFLKLCKDETADPLKLKSRIDMYHAHPGLMGDRNNHKHSLLPADMLYRENDTTTTSERPNNDIETNEIPDNTVNGRPVHDTQSGQKTVCVVCEFVMKQLDDMIKDKHNEDEIKNAVHSVCKTMPKSVRAECDQFVDKYADLVISLLAQELEPDEVCQELKLCSPPGGFKAVKREILDCAVCETVVMAVKKVLNNDKVDHNIVHIVEKACGLLPAKYSARCHTMMEIYGDSVIHLIEEYSSKVVCQKIGLCTDYSASYVHERKNKH